MSRIPVKLVVLKPDGFEAITAVLMEEQVVSLNLETLRLQDLHVVTGLLKH